jgi:hypothetical protein
MEESESLAEGKTYRDEYFRDAQEIVLFHGYIYIYIYIHMYMYIYETSIYTYVDVDGLCVRTGQT